MYAVISNNSFHLGYQYMIQLILIIHRLTILIDKKIVGRDHTFYYSTW